MVGLSLYKKFFNYLCGVRVLVLTILKFLLLGGKWCPSCEKTTVFLITNCGEYLKITRDVVFHGHGGFSEVFWGPKAASLVLVKFIINISAITLRPSIGIHNIKESGFGLGADCHQFFESVEHLLDHVEQHAGAPWQTIDDHSIHLILEVVVHHMNGRHDCRLGETRDGYGTEVDHNVEKLCVMRNC